MTTELTERPEASPLAALLHDPEKLSALPIETVERLWAMQKEAQADQARRDFMSAFADVQAEMPRVIRDSENTQTRSRYAKLEAFHRALRPVYTAHGFSIMHREEKPEADGCVRVVATLMHRSGHSEMSSAEVPIDDRGIAGKVNKTATHAKGSTLTYATRYVDTLIFAPEMVDEDTDGVSLDGAGAEPVTEEQAANLQALIEKTGASLDRFLEYGRVASLSEFPARRYREAVSMLERKRSR